VRLLCREKYTAVIARKYLHKLKAGFLK